MKYLKTFESIGYKIGDYILLDNSTIKWAVDLECKIIDKTIIKKSVKYKIETFNDGALTSFYIHDYEIDRKMTDDEVKEYKIKKDINKYNI